VDGLGRNPQAARTYGLKRLPAKRKRRVDQTSRKHLEWFVRYQFGGESPPEIAKSPDQTERAVTSSAVRKALEKVATYFDLTLRNGN
jgi:hypothetical protein